MRGCEIQLGNGVNLVSKWNMHTNKPDARGVVVANITVLGERLVTWLHANSTYMFSYIPELLGE